VIRRHGAFIDLKPPAVPGMLPSALLRRRPDIKAAELRLDGADATIEARRAQFLPTVQISGAVGGLFINALNYDPVTVWSIGASVLAPLFTGGALTAQLGVATAQRDEAAYAYRAAVLRAFSDIENALASVESYDRQIASLRTRRAILLDSLGMAQERHGGGYASYPDVLDAQRNLFSVELDAIGARGAQLNNATALYRVLGGGWSGDGLAQRLDAPVGERAAPAIR
jgi:outer membrane protein TolC